ncbi:hypothetical protein Glove_220g34 [Diversispora epigaea]|uniref:Protein kinase domain-containing protein n=1 Tax=Diversispora epigaea TaxID=1348612 RepID=A0A397II97_9GLOM|nr:hypothetical protein Glove_220g34 [Diversispora epigaea]
MDQNDKTLIKNNKNNKCSKCGITKKIIISTNQLCRKCFAMNSLFINSGNVNINYLIKESQFSKKPKHGSPYLEWVPFEEFTNIKKIGQGGFSQIFKATWKVNVCISYKGTIKRSKREIVLKVLSSSQNVDTGFLNELKNTFQFRDTRYGHNSIKNIIKCYGVTQDPQTKNYAFILEYANDGDLHHFIHKNFETFTWSDKIEYLNDVIKGIKYIHDKKIVHRDLHSGNILVNRSKVNNVKIPIISDLGFSQPANIDSNLSRESQIYGIIPYMAPELFKSQPYSYASDIYSLGMIMWELTSGHRPFHDQEHGPKLILDILDGKRPEITEDTPEWWENLMKRCWNPDPSQRPKIEEIRFNFNNNELNKAEDKRLEMIKSKKPFVKNPGYEHPNSRYYSISLNSMLESINSTISDMFSNNDNLYSNDRFDIMNINSNQINDLVNSNINGNSNTEKFRKHFLDELLEEEIIDQDDFKRRRIAEYFVECFK